MCITQGIAGTQGDYKENQMEQTARRPSALMRQLDCLWKGLEQLKSESPDDGEPQSEGGTPTDPGDITVYFENSLVGP
jgi:hypothetical protein